MKLIVISDPEFFVGEANIINAMFESGLQRFHIRKPEAKDDAIRKLLKDIDSKYYEKISLHQHHDIADDFGIKVLHYTEKNRVATSTHKLERQKEQGYRLSTSVHSVEDIEKLKEFDYVFLGPVFDSISKKGYKGKFKEGFQLKNNRKNDIIAIGGIGENNIEEVAKMNFDGVAILGSVWNQKEKAIEQFEKMQRLCQSVLMY